LLRSRDNRKYANNKNLLFVFNRHVKEVCSVLRVYLAFYRSLLFTRSDYIDFIVIPNIMSSYTLEQHGFAKLLMLEKINKLFACRVRDLVSLPQIVVVSDQSSGKSSVLEGLIRKLLLRNSGLCT
jgi:hypothetical protein